MPSWGIYDWTGNDMLLADTALRAATIALDKYILPAEHVVSLGWLRLWDLLKLLWLPLKMSSKQSLQLQWCFNCCICYTYFDRDCFIIMSRLSVLPLSHQLACNANSAPQRSRKIIDIVQLIYQLHFLWPKETNLIPAVRISHHYYIF